MDKKIKKMLCRYFKGGFTGQEVAQNKKATKHEFEEFIRIAEKRVLLGQ